MKHDLTTGTWQDDTGCPISIILVSTSDAIIWLVYSNQLVIQGMNQVANQFTNQPNKWIWMMCFQTNVHKSTMLFSLIAATNRNLLQISQVLMKRLITQLLPPTVLKINGKCQHQSISIPVDCVNQPPWQISSQQHTCTWQDDDASHLPAHPSLLSAHLVDCHVGFSLLR